MLTNQEKKYNEIKTKMVLYAKDGFLKHAIPIEYGGYGDKFYNLYKAHQKLGYETKDTSLILSLNAHIWGALFPLLLFGNDEQKQEFFQGLLIGDIIAGHAITEPDAGSDLTSITTKAILQEKYYILNGRKRYITNCIIADLIIVYAKTKKGLSAFIVLKHDKGVKFSDAHKVSGFINSPIGEIIFDNCLLPANRLLGKLELGSIMIQKALELERAFLFAGIVGVMQWQLEQVIAYSKTRVVSGKILREYKNISHKIAEMSLALETIKLWLEKCATVKDSNKSISLLSSYIKLYASEEFLKMSQNCVQILGAYGLEINNSFSQFVLDGLAGRLLSGTSEIQKNIINGLIGSGKN